MTLYLSRMAWHDSLTIPHGMGITFPPPNLLYLFPLLIYSTLPIPPPNLLYLFHLLISSTLPIPLLIYSTLPIPPTLPILYNQVLVVQVVNSGV